jgi:hypothetical protein
VDTPASGEVPSYNAAQGKFEWIAAAAAGLKKVAEVTVTSNTTQVTITGLDINTDKFYLFVMVIKNPTASAASYGMYFQGDLTNTNYYYQDQYNSGSSIGGSRYNNPYFCNLEAGDCAVNYTFVFRDPSGFPHFYAINGMRTAGNVYIRNHHGCKTATVTNVTQIDIKTDVSGAIGAGSRIIIYGAAG